MCLKIQPSFPISRRKKDPSPNRRALVVTNTFVHLRGDGHEHTHICVPQCLVHMLGTVSPCSLLRKQPPTPVYRHTQSWGHRDYCCACPHQHSRDSTPVSRPTKGSVLTMTMDTNHSLYPHWKQAHPVPTRWTVGGLGTESGLGSVLGTGCSLMAQLYTLTVGTTPSSPVGTVRTQRPPCPPDTSMCRLWRWTQGHQGNLRTPAS